MVSIICHCAVSVSWRLYSMSACSVPLCPAVLPLGISSNIIPFRAFRIRRSRSGHSGHHQLATVPIGCAAGFVYAACPRNMP